MIVDERFLTYLRSLEGQEIDYIAAIEKEALETYVPIIRKDTQTFMKFLMQTLRPEQILEVGTAVGFSALLMESLMMRFASSSALVISRSATFFR